jgi:hypothetical protein
MTDAYASLTQLGHESRIPDSPDAAPSRGRG